MATPAPLLAVILAAGGSTRFVGGAKQLTTVNGSPLVEIAVGAALGAGCFDEVVVVTGAVDLAAVLSPRVKVLHTSQWSEGQAASLQAGLEYARSTKAIGAVVGLADQPLVGSEDWRLVATSGLDDPIVVATYAGVRGNPVRLMREVWEDLPTIGDEGARVLMRKRPELVGEVACPGDSHDVDTVEDLEQWN